MSVTQKFQAPDHIKPGASPCPHCTAPLRFFTDLTYGALYEVCDTVGCPFNTPHRPVSVGAVLPPYVAKSRRKKH